MKSITKTSLLMIAVVCSIVALTVLVACGGPPDTGLSAAPADREGSGQERDSAQPTVDPAPPSPAAVNSADAGSDTSPPENPRDSEKATEASATRSPTAVPEPTEQPASPTQVNPTAVPATDIPVAQPKAVQRPTPVLDLAIGGRAGNLAPEFKGISNWINSEPLTMSDLQGKVVLIDFWTYTCVNCIRTFPFLKEWHAKYAGHGLVIVGVHSPEFDFEKLPENVARSTAESGLLYPIAQDNDFETWRAYSNRYWPAKYLIDHNGVVRYTHFGEGAYDETEHWIRDVLGETGVDLSGIEANADPGPSPDPKAFTSNHKERITREIYAGYQRNSSPMGLYISNTEYYKGSERVVTYSDMEPHQNQFMYLQGPWFNGLEELRHARETQNNEDHIALKFFASSVNAVIDSANGDSFQVDVTMDGRALLPEEAGADLILADGRSFLEVDEGRMYMVVELSEFGGHELRLSSNSDKFEFFAFTFGAYPSGP